MVLESHSLKMALARFHLTTPHTLREVRSDAEAKEAARQVEVLQQGLEAIEQADAVDYGALKSLRVGPDEEDKEEERKGEDVGVEDGRGDGPPEQAAVPVTDTHAHP